MKVINKYLVKMFEKGKTTLSRSTSTIAASEEEAIENVRKDPFWYNEGTGYDYKKLNYPLTFKAEINNESTT